MRRIPLLAASLLFFSLLALAQTASPAPAAGAAAPAKPPAFQLTDLQAARLDAVRQKVLRWQDRINDALAEFSQVCVQAQKENHWPAVQCSLADLSIAPVPPPAPSAPTTTAAPASKTESKK